MRKFRFSMATVKLWFVLKLVKWMARPYMKKAPRAIRSAWRAM